MMFFTLFFLSPDSSVSPSLTLASTPKNAPKRPLSTGLQDSHLHSRSCIAVAWLDALASSQSSMVAHGGPRPPGDSVPACTGGGWPVRSVGL